MIGGALAIRTNSGTRQKSDFVTGSQAKGDGFRSEDQGGDNVSGRRGTIDQPALPK